MACLVPLPVGQEPGAATHACQRLLLHPGPCASVVPKSLLRPVSRGPQPPPLPLHLQDRGRACHPHAGQNESWDAHFRSSRKARTQGEAVSCNATVGLRQPRLRTPRTVGAPRASYLPLLVPGPLGRPRAARRLGPRAVDELQQVLHAPVVHHALRERVRFLRLLLLPLGQPQAELLPHLCVVPAGRGGWRLRRPQEHTATLRFQF